MNSKVGVGSLIILVVALAIAGTFWAAKPVENSVKQTKTIEINVSAALGLKEVLTAK